ncbi:g4863 [Coccomyxa elongata]
MAARILIAGCSSGVAAEVAKNIALAGVGSLSLLDDALCKSEGAVCNFLIPADADQAQSVAEVSAATLREMNPLVKITALPGSLPPIPDVEFLRGFEVILITSAPFSTLLQYDAACRQLGVAFFMAASCGSTSFFFANLHSHEYSPLDTPAGEVPSKGVSAFPSLASALSQPWKTMRARYTHKLVYVLRVCADFESHAGRFPAAADLPALQERARELAADARVAASADPASAPPPRDLITEDVMPADILEEYVTGTVELPPVNAVLGGVLANEVLKAVSHKGEPVNNFFFFSLGDNVGLVENLGEVV